MENIGWQHCVLFVAKLCTSLLQNTVTALLASRVNKAIELYRKNLGIKLIMTGGQGEDEVVAEASAMTSYALERGVTEEVIILENQATNTEENILYIHRPR